MVCSIVILKNIPASLLTGYELTGLSRGGQQVSKCQEVYAKAVKLLVELASLQVMPLFKNVLKSMLFCLFLVIPL